MKMKKLFALIMAAAMTLGLLSGCGSKTPAEAPAPEQGTTLGGDASGAGEHAYGPVYDDWSEKTEDELYELAKNEGGVINIYATSSKMLKLKEPFEAAYPGLKLEVSDLDTDEVLSKARIENETGNVTADVLQTKDVNGNVFFDYYDEGVLEPYYPKDICAHIDPDLLRYSYPLYSSQSFWYYNTEAFPDGQPVNSWWQIIEKDASGKQRFHLYTKEIAQESAYMSLFTSFINNADQMEQSYKDTYGKDLEYTYDASAFNFEVPEKNAGVEYLWRFSQMEMTFIGDGDELVLAVNNSTVEEPALALASAGKITNRDESGYNIAWVIGLSPYTALLNCESMFVVKGCDNPAGARLFIRYVTGGADGKSGGLAPFMKEGNWPVRDDVADDWNPAKLSELGAITNNLDEIYAIYMDVQDMWTYWLNQNPNM